MTATPNLPGPERVKELREWVIELRNLRWASSASHGRWADLLAILDSYNALPALQEEVERWQCGAGKLAHDLAKLQSKYDHLREKSETENAGLRAEVEELRRVAKLSHSSKNRTLVADFVAMRTRAEKAEADLAAARPVIEAAMGAGITELTNEVFMFASYPKVQAILRAALALREKAEKAEEKGEGG